MCVAKRMRRRATMKRVKLVDVFGAAAACAALVMRMMRAARRRLANKQRVVRLALISAARNVAVCGGSDRATAAAATARTRTWAAMPLRLGDDGIRRAIVGRRRQWRAIRGAKRRVDLQSARRFVVSLDQFEPAGDRLCSTSLFSAIFELPRPSRVRAPRRRLRWRIARATRRA